MALAVLTLLTIIIQLLGGVFAQITTNVICQPSYSWMSNSKGQNPCLVNAYLDGVCNNGQWEVLSLPPGYSYNPPVATESTNLCLCSTVTYSLLAACSICQDRGYYRWSYYSSNCTGPLLEKFVGPIPPQTSVPAWAYLDVTVPNTFNITAAQADINAPESTAPGPTSTSSTSSTSTTSTSSSFSISTTAYTTSTYTSPASFSSAPSSVSKKPSNAGAIAGGVVGGLVGLGLIATAIAIFFTRHHRGRELGAASLDGTRSDRLSDAPPHSPPSMSQEHGSPVHGFRPYNPSDPTTFPSASVSPISMPQGSKFLPEV